MDAQSVLRHQCVNGADHFLSGRIFVLLQKLAVFNKAFSFFLNRNNRLFNGGVDWFFLPGFNVSVYDFLFFHFIYFLLSFLLVF